MLPKRKGTRVRNQCNQQFSNYRAITREHLLLTRFYEYQESCTFSKMREHFFKYIFTRAHVVGDIDPMFHLIIPQTALLVTCV